MTQLLVSVKNLAEAKMALDLNVDFIDLKNPADGALGALAPDVIEQVVQFVACRKLISATIGNLAMQPESIIQQIQQTERLGVDIVKVGFTNEPLATACIKAIHDAHFKTKIIGVLFADHLPKIELISFFAAAKFHGVMLDTQAKTTKNLFDYMSEKDIEKFILTAKAASILIGLAGKLSFQSVGSALNLAPDFIGVRSAVCRAGVREGTISSLKIKALKKLLQKNNTTHIKITCSS